MPRATSIASWSRRSRCSRWRRSRRSHPSPWPPGSFRRRWPQGDACSSSRIASLPCRTPSAPRPTPPARPALALEGVSARYAPDEPLVLEAASFRLDPGRKVALVGPSGAGKTTVVNLLLRFLDPETGRVTLAGRDLREYRQEDVRQAIAVAGQDSHLFSTSIRENVRLARPGRATPRSRARCVVRSSGTWVCSLPDGLDTLVGEAGRELSGGQRQRLVLARALLADAPLLVLDEPTAHLDPETAEALVGDILTAADDRSVLLDHPPSGGTGAGGRDRGARRRSDSVGRSCRFTRVNSVDDCRTERAEVRDSTL